MSAKSQEKNMRRLASLLSQDLGYIWGERECGPNGAKKEFLNLGKVFLRALAKDLELRKVSVRSNAAGIAVSGECTLTGAWEQNGIEIELSQYGCGNTVILYRSTLDGKRQVNHYLSLENLRSWSYDRLLYAFSSLRYKGGLYRAA